tara:strand:+ start:713 stop:1204 length:492 start_codon:yes stop_codon:yes gene_type:complete
MWTVIKIKSNSHVIVKEELKKKLNKEIQVYIPKILVQINNKKKLINKSISLLGDYIFCFHEDFENNKIIDHLKFTKGVKYFLNGHSESQEEIQIFIDKCKKLENDKGFISKSLFDLNLKSFYQFKSGLLANKIFQLIEIQKNKIKVLVNGIKFIENKKFLINP